MTKIAVVVASLAGLVAACESTMDPDKYQQIMAKYAVLDTHKAIVAAPQNYRFYYTWSQSSPIKRWRVPSPIVRRIGPFLVLQCVLTTRRFTTRCWVSR